MLWILYWRSLMLWFFIDADDLPLVMLQTVSLYNTYLKKENKIIIIYRYIGLTHRHKNSKILKAVPETWNFLIQIGLGVEPTEKFHKPKIFLSMYKQNLSSRTQEENFSILPGYVPFFQNLGEYILTNHYRSYFEWLWETCSL